MKRISAALVVVAFTLVLGACAHHGGRHGDQGKPAGAAQASSVIYWCDCGPECKCNAVSTKPGKCGCGKEMAGGHVVFMEGNTALVCTCGPTCACALDPNDRTKCACGKPVKRINLEGTGIQFCNCAGSCGCNSVSDRPGTCAACGMQLHPAK